MTLKDLVRVHLISEQEEITVARKLGLYQTYDVRVGCWCDDQILDFFNMEIDQFTWSFKRGLMVIVR